MPTVVEVAPGVRLLGETQPNAAYAFETADGVVLVDTCAQEDARPILEQLRTARLDAARLKWILLTHAHGDHSLGARRLREISGARIHAGRGDAAVLRAGAPREAFFSVFKMPFREHATPVDVELDGGEVLEMGDARVRVIATPGHTPGSVCYLLERGGARTLFTGDTVISLTDDDLLAGPGIYPAYLAPRYRGDAEAFLGSLRTLRALPAPDFVLPGHPSADPSPQDARVEPADWEGLLDRGIAKLDILIARRRRDGADFLDGRAKELLPGLHYWGDVKCRALYALVARPGELVLFGVPDAPDPLEFVARRCKERGLPAMRPKAVVISSPAPRDLEGLDRLVRASGCVVVAPRAHLAAVRSLCPPGAHVVAASDLPGLGWFPVEVVNLEVPGSTEAAYALTISGKTVVVTGRYPAAAVSPERARELLARFQDSEQVEAYLRSLARLERVRPNLWLPLVPFGGASANVYDDDWTEHAIEGNRIQFR